MVKQKHIGLVVFAICSALSARIALFEPKPHAPTPVEERWGRTQKYEDPLGFVRGLRYYIYGLGVIGLLFIVEDHLSEALRAKKKEGRPDDNPSGMK